MKNVVALLVVLVGCGGPAFVGTGSPSAVDSSTAASSGAPASGDASFTGDSSSGMRPPEASASSHADSGDRDASDVDGEAYAPDVRTADAEDASPDCPDVGCHCVVATPPACPAGWPYVPKGGGMCCNWPAP